MDVTIAIAIAPLPGIDDKIYRYFLARDALTYACTCPCIGHPRKRRASACSFPIKVFKSDYTKT